MRPKNTKMIMKTPSQALGLLLLSALATFGQQIVNLEAKAANAILPDGSSVPMWGYSCMTGSTGCSALNTAAGANWSPVVITVPTGTALVINLKNSLPSPVPTSLVIVGQLGGGLGSDPRASGAKRTDPSPLHDNLGTTWPIANAGGVNVAPGQPDRVRSFATEASTGNTANLTWSAPRAGTYLIESGTHPSIQGPMGLYGILVVTSAPASALGTFTAYPGVPYNADLPLLLSEIDPAQNAAVDAAVKTTGFQESATYGPYTGGPIASISVTNGGSNYTSAPSVTFSPAGAAGDAVVDTDNTSPTFGQVTGINITTAGNYTIAPKITIGASGGGGATALATAALQLNVNAQAHCSGGASACYPPAVNYTPLYYLINGVAFDKTNASASMFPTFPTRVTAPSGTVLLRVVNAGSRMHVPSVVGSQTGTVNGFSLIAEDGNPLPGVPRVQSEVFMAAGKTYDLMINAPATGGTALPIYDRQLSLSGNATNRDSGMLAYISANGNGLPTSLSAAANLATANPDTYGCAVAGCTSAALPGVVPGRPLAVTDPNKGVMANDVNIYGVQLVGGPRADLTLYTNGTFNYTGSTTTTFTYCGNGGDITTTPTKCALVTLNLAPIEGAGGISLVNKSFSSNLSKTIHINAPGILTGDKDGAGYPLTVAFSAGNIPVASTADVNLSVDPSGAFTASIASCTNPAGCTRTFTYKAQNSQGTASSARATVTILFQQANGPAISVVDGADLAAHRTPSKLTDYRWVIEEDRTFYVDPTKTTNTGAVTGGTSVLTFGTNFHTSYMPLVAQGCVGTVSCGTGQTVLGVSSAVNATLDPTLVHLDTTKRYYLTVLPGDGADSLAPNSVGKGHSMGGASLSWSGTQWTSLNMDGTKVEVIVEPTPLPPSKLTVFVFEDDFPLNGEADGGGGVDVLAPNEPGLGGFNITIFDDAGGPGDPTGQVDYDMFNQPLSNSLAGTIDPATHLDACPISVNSRTGSVVNPRNPTSTIPDATQTGITGTITTCPKFESDGIHLSPLAGQAVIANMMPGRYGVVATPAADRIARGEEWLQTNTLDGQKAHDSFLKVGEPAYFQEYGPASFHVTIGFANPKIINARLALVCNGGDPASDVAGSNCHNSVDGTVTTERLSRTPDERLYSSGSNDSFSFTQCYVSVGDPDGEDFAFTKCDSNGKFTLSGLPDGTWRVTVFDQWNDMLVDGLSTPVRLGGGTVTHMGDIATNQWQANIYTSTFFDKNGNGVFDDNEAGLTLVPTNIRFRDGSYSNFNNTDLAGQAGFNEVFPLFNWYVVETDDTRYKNTGTHVVYDAGGPADGSPSCTSPTVPTAPCANSSIGHLLARTAEDIPVPTALRVPGARYCAVADCASGDTAGGSTGRVDPPWVTTEGWQGFSSQNNFLEFGKKPFADGETGGIHGHVVYASTRPFDDPQLLLQTSWEPLVPNVTINLYQEGTAPDGTQSLKLVDTTKTSSFDDWAQGFRSDGVPNMNCPGQGLNSGTNADLFFFSLYKQPMYLDVYSKIGTSSPAIALPNNSQFKCYDGMHNWNQLQPAPYDGRYQFPSTTIDPSTGKVNGTSCTACVRNPDSSDPYRYGAAPAAGTLWSPADGGAPMLPPGKYIVEVVVPAGYELVKEEDKNILIGDTFIAPVTVQFPGVGGSVYILPDQASVGSYNNKNAQNPTTSLGRNSSRVSHEGDTGSIESYWPCAGAMRTVPDYISLYPQSQEVAPFAGTSRHLCDRKEITLDPQTSALAKFYVFTSTHVAAHFTGVITDDFTSEFDPFSPQFGEKFAPPDLPVSVKDWNGNEISRVYADHWGTYNGLNYSTWEVNPPNPTGYSPTMMTMCMNDPGRAATPDPLFNPAYSQFCYSLPFMPGQTQYMDTPVTPTSAFAGAGYNNPDCAYPENTPAISYVEGDGGVGPWLSAGGTGHVLKIHSLGDVQVNNNAYSGPSATTAPYNLKTIARHYHFGTTAGTVSIGGHTIPASQVSWHNDEIDVTVSAADANAIAVGTAPSPLNPSPGCPVPQQQSLYGGVSGMRCGQLVITASNGQQSIDTVTVTIGGKQPTRLTAGQTIQSAINAANPGDLIMVPQGVYNEILVMWKPVRLQGVGAATTVINANTHPSGKLDPWRHMVNCLFGLALNGQPNTASNSFDPTGADQCGGWAAFDTVHPQVDRLPLEGILGWDTSVNGNLAQLLQEPTLMGAYEGAGITVLGKGVKLPTGTDPFSTAAFGSGVESAFPAGTQLLNGSSDCQTGSGSSRTNPYPSNFYCNPSQIDGLSVTNSSQGGGGIFLHAWAHYLQISNNRVYNNSGTLTGGITLGQGESPDAYLQGDAGNADPGSCEGNILTPAGKQLPYCFDYFVGVHHNEVVTNSSIGDELYSSTPAGGGGVTICTGADYYKFQYNWVCGNLSTGDGGGLVHLGFIKNGLIEHNSVLFNQSVNPTVPTNGGGILAMGAPPDGLTAAGLECGNTAADADCRPGLSDGTGPGLVINANLVMGNAAESGSGGGIRLQNVNGTEVLAFPTGIQAFGGLVTLVPTAQLWNDVTITNNVIANNVAGWDGAGISLSDALNVDIVNNTIMSNDTTASSGVLFNTLGAPIASSQGPSQTGQNNGSSSLPQPAGLVAIQNSSVLSGSLPTTVTCPAGHFAGGSANNGTCRNFSYPRLYNDVFYQNRAFYIGVGGLGGTTQNQQNVVAMYNAFTNNPVVSQPSASSMTSISGSTVITGGTGACVGGVSYWDLGVRGDLSPSTHESTVTLNPVYSFVTAGYGGSNNSNASPAVVSQYCNGSRVPPEFNSSSFQVPPGISDATVPNPFFSLQPAATVDEGNNWINMSWGPLTTMNPVTSTQLANYGPAGGSPVVNYIPSSANGTTGAYTLAPSTDFFGNARKTNNFVDAGAIEFQPPAGVSVLPTALTFTNVVAGSTSTAQSVILYNNTATNLTAINAVVTAPFARATAAQGGPGTCPTAAGGTLAAGANCTYNIVFSAPSTPTTGGTSTGTFTVTSSATVTGSPVALTGIATPQTLKATVSPSPLNFGNWATGTTSGTLALTVTNTGNGPLAGGLFTFGGASVFSSRPGTCTATLAVGASCTLNAAFAPTGVTSYNGTLTVAYTGATVSPTPVALTGTGVAARATVSITPNPLTITLPTGILNLTGTGTVTLTNTALAGGSSVLVTNAVVAGGNVLTYTFTKVNGTDNCTGTSLTPGASCTVGVRFTNALSSRGTNRTGTITFTDSGAASPQTGNLIGFATP